MAVFLLKARDTLPIFEVGLKNPDGSAHDLTGSTTWKLHVKRDDGTTFTRDMVKEGLDTAGVLRYTWQAADWNGGGLPIPEQYQVADLQMEYEVVGGSSRMTFPNDGYDTLRIRGDLG